MGAEAAKRTCPACRYTLLSGYNDEPLCGSCLRSAKTAEGVASTWMWDSAPLREALARADMSAVLAVLRGASGMSQLDFGQVLGWSQSVVTKIERRQRRTFHDVGEILKVCDLLGMPREALLPLILGSPDAMLGTDDEVMFLGVDGVDRRQFNLTAAGIALAAMIPPPERIDRGHVRYLEACLEKVRSQDRVAGDGRQLEQTVRLYWRARQMLDDSDYSEAVGHQLLAVTAGLANFAGWLAYDAGQQKLARSLYTDAAQLADSVGIPEQQVHVYANLTQQSSHLSWSTGQRGFAREALRFAERAVDAARHISSPKLHSLIALRQSLVHVRLDDSPAYRSSISRARRELDRLGQYEDPDLSWTSFMTASEITGFEAMGASLLGNPGKAVDLYRAVLDDKNRSPRDLLYYRACLAGALCTAGDTKTAVDVGLAALPAPGERIGSMRALGQLSPVRASLGRPEDDEFCVRFDAAALMLAPASV